MKKIVYKIIAILIIINILICSTCISQVKANTILIWPVPGHTERSQGFHEGRAIDISDGSIYGANVVAAIGGTVIYKFTCGSNHIEDGQYYTIEHSDWTEYVCTHVCGEKYGNGIGRGAGTGIVIRGDDERTYEYAHMLPNSIPSNINDGDRVEAGQKIGQVGNTGLSTGAHLHFGITKNWNYWDSSNINPNNETYNYNGDATPPTIEFAYIDEKSLNGSSYKVMVKASDENGIDRVEFKTFTPGKAGADGRTDDDLIVRNGTYNSQTGYYETTVYKSEHNNEDGLYLTEVYVFDKKGNHTHKVFEPISINSVYTNLGEFEARIALKYNTNYVIGKKDKNVVVKEKNLKDDTQIWKFTKGDSGDYKITNKSTGLVMDVQELKDVNGTNIILHTSSNQVNQRFYIFEYNGGYRLSARCSGDLKGIDVPNLKLEDGHQITIGCTNSVANRAQTWELQKVATKISIVSDKNEINVGDTINLNAKIEPTDVNTKNVLWESDNEDIATITENGIVTAHKSGTVKIKATTTDGSNLSATYTINVVEKAPVINKFEIDKTSLVMNVNEIATLNINLESTVTLTPHWTSSDNSVVEILQGGNNTTIRVIGLKKGKSTITVELSTGEKRTCEVEVVAPSKSITLDKEILNLNVGENYTLKANVLPEDSSYQKITWESNDTSVATVDNNGNVKAIAQGIAKITAKTEDGTRNSCVVLVLGRQLPITTLPYTSMMSFNAKTKINSIVNKNNFPILEENYKVEVYDKNGNLKNKTDNLGSKDKIQVKDNYGDTVSEFTVVVPGDVTGNGNARMYDSFQILKDSINGKEIDEIETTIRDFNGDGKVRMYDAFQFLKQAVLGK